MRYLHVLLFVFTVSLLTMGCSSGSGSDDHTGNPETTIPAENPGVTPEGPIVVPGQPGDSNNPPTPGEGGGVQEPGSGGNEDSESSPGVPTTPSDPLEDQESLVAAQYVPEGRSHSYQVRVTVKNTSSEDITYWMVSFVPPVAAEQVTCWGSTSSTMNDQDGVLKWIPTTLQFRRMAPGESRDMYCQINLKYRHEGYSGDERVISDLSVVKIL